MTQSHHASKSISFVRKLAIFISILLIPAFIMGVASVWSFICALLMAYLARQQLKILITDFQPIEEDADRCRLIGRRLFMIGAENALLVMVPYMATILMIMFGVISSNSGFFISSVDGKFYNEFTALFYEGLSYETLDENIKIKIIILLYAGLNMLMLTFVTSWPSFKVLREARSQALLDEWRQQHNLPSFVSEFIKAVGILVIILLGLMGLLLDPREMIHANSENFIYATMIGLTFLAYSYFIYCVLSVLATIDLIVDLNISKNDKRGE
jgi:uncharacterized membrane protein